MKNLIFLDIDGVLKPFKYEPEGDICDFWHEIGTHFSAVCVNVLNELCDSIIDEHGDVLEIIISSDWRLGYDMYQLKEIFKENGIWDYHIRNITGFTPVTLGQGRYRHRGDEIEGYLKENNITECKMVIIDDMGISFFTGASIFDQFEPRIITTDPIVGITKENTENILQIFRDLPPVIKEKNNET